MKSENFSEEYTLDFSRTEVLVLITDSSEQPPESESEEDQPDSEEEEEFPHNGPVVPPAPALEVSGHARSKRRTEEVVFRDAFKNDVQNHGPDETKVASEELAQLESQLQINSEAEEEDFAATDGNRRFEDAEEDDISSEDSAYSEPVDPILTIPIGDDVFHLYSSGPDQPAGTLNLRVHSRFPQLRSGDPLPLEASELAVEAQEQWLSRPGLSKVLPESHDPDRSLGEDEELPELVLDDADDADPSGQVAAPADDGQSD
ncbi:hypothetical protein FGB62_277g02 [Gracilaria domingensis]|nr:hypothetical protein FGB62_277g02 [Gracilaria domingensis]